MAPVRGPFHNGPVWSRCKSKSAGRDSPCQVRVFVHLRRRDNRPIPYTAPMRFGVTLPNAGYGGDPATLIQFAVDAEEAGWDGVFFWDTPYAAASDEPPMAFADAWTLLAGAAIRTERVRLGTMLTPLAWRRPWLIARQAATVDRLSGGRLTLSAGLGAPDDEGPWFGGDASDRRVRAAMLDEALTVIRGLWSGEPFAFTGDHFSLREVTFLPPPLQRPRIPIWMVGAWPRDPAMWPRRRSMRRALRCDGLLPNVFGPDGELIPDASPDDLRAMSAWIERERAGEGPYDIVIERSLGALGADEARAEADRWGRAGATWWLDDVWWEMYAAPDDPEPLRRRLRRGPPR